jgi:hypothetical protein
MSDERRYNEEEVAEILERATASESSRTPVRASEAHGLTLSELQEIGSEVGIAPSRIAEAARSVGSRLPAEPQRMFLGAPRSVSRSVLIDRPLDDDEWNRLVVDLRETFSAVGKTRVQGNLRSWMNGNLQVHVEPHGEAWRVRMRTLKGDASPLAGLSASFFAVALIFILMTGLGEMDSSGIMMATVFALAGLGQLGWVRAMLPRWAETRESQMEGLAQRIPLLLKDQPAPQ